MPRPDKSRPARSAPESMANVLRLLPARWALAIVVALIAYVLMQPRLNAWFGWSLPSIPTLLGQDTPPRATTASQRERDATKSPRGTPSRSPEKPLPEALKYGFLKELGRDRYESPAGLVYSRGSEEGHRLAHLERHLRNDPDRVGPHGVFEGSMAEFLRAIDDTYRRARGHAKGTRTRNEEAETVYEAPFDKTIGYLGGSVGRERGNPPLKRMRVVVRDKNVITAFPIPGN
ncbi:MAG: hypothetical protein MUF23_02355 [Pirellula sp.]|nr:hypothetical protein [Pirellula sp.]